MPEEEHQHFEQEPSKEPVYETRDGRSLTLKDLEQENPHIEDRADLEELLK